MKIEQTAFAAAVVAYCKEKAKSKHDGDWVCAAIRAYLEHVHKHSANFDRGMLEQNCNSEIPALRNHFATQNTDNASKWQDAGYGMEFKKRGATLTFRDKPTKTSEDK